MVSVVICKEIHSVRSDLYQHSPKKRKRLEELIFAEAREAVSLVGLAQQKGQDAVSKGAVSAGGCQHLSGRSHHLFHYGSWPGHHHTRLMARWRKRVQQGALWALQRESQRQREKEIKILITHENTNCYTAVTRESDGSTKVHFSRF